MAQLDVIKESVQYEQLLRESSSSHVLKGEYLIRDSYADIKEVLGVEAKAVVNSKEVLGDKVTVEGQLTYTVFYIPKEDIIEDGEGSTVNSVSFSERFANYLETNSDEHNVTCEVECQIEHIEASLMNERKVGIDGILTLEWALYKQGEFEYVKDIEGKEDIQVLKKQENLNKTKGEKEIELLGKSIMKVTMDKPEVAQILKCELNLHKKELKLAEDKVYIGCYCKAEVLYKGKDKGELVVLSDDVYLSKEEELVGITNEMLGMLTLDIKNYEIGINADDLGENRIVNLEFIINGKAKVFSEEKMEVIKDCYSPTSNIELNKTKVQIGMVNKPYVAEAVVKENLYIEKDEVKLEQIISSSCKVIVADKIVEDDKIKVEGILKAGILYKAAKPEVCYGILNGEIPFSVAIDAKGVKDTMNVIVKVNAESFDANIEGNSISVRANVLVNAKVCYKIEKECIINVEEVEGEKKEKKASITIYVITAGDTLWELAKKYNTTKEEIIKLNEMECDAELKPGQKLIIPGRAIF